MMSGIKWLHLVRHGKSGWEYNSVADIDRPLKERGIHAAYEMAKRFNGQYPLPDLIKTSPASRALNTAIIFARVLDLETSKIEITEAIYEAPESTVIDVIKNTHHTVDSLMLFGHNPTFTNLANRFFTEYITNIPTCGMISVKLELEDWQKLQKANVIQANFDYPRNSE